MIFFFARTHAGYRCLFALITLIKNTFNFWVHVIMIFRYVYKFANVLCTVFFVCPFSFTIVRFRYASSPIRTVYSIDDRQRTAKSFFTFTAICYADLRPQSEPDRAAHTLCLSLALLPRLAGMQSNQNKKRSTNLIEIAMIAIKVTTKKKQPMKIPGKLVRSGCSFAMPRFVFRHRMKTTKKCEIFRSKIDDKNWLYVYASPSRSFK